MEDEQLLGLAACHLYRAQGLQVSLAVSDANMELPWDLLEESAGYLGKLAHVTARSRLSEDYELRVLQLCSQIRKCLEIIENEARRFWDKSWILKPHR